MVARCNGNKAVVRILIMQAYSVQHLESLPGVRAEALICHHPIPQCLACLANSYFYRYCISFQAVEIRDATLLFYLLYRGGQHELCLGATAIFSTRWTSECQPTQRSGW